MPPTSTIQKWSEDFDVLVLFYKGLYKRPRGNHKKLVSRAPYQTENVSEFERLMSQAHANRLKVVVYCSFFSCYRKNHNFEPSCNQINLLKEKFNIDGVCFIAAALDHCINPQKVLEEAYRCLSPGGTIVIIQGLESGHHQLHVLRRLFGHLCHPKALLARIYNTGFYRAQHLRHFTSTDLTSLLERVGFLKISTDTISSSPNIHILEAIK